ncbi:MAG: zinc-binding dehydrogenase [Caldilineaceae bacterium]
MHESMLIPKPTGLSFRHAAMAEPLSIAMHAAARTPIPLMGTVAVIGAGTIGLLTLQSARLKGAGKIIVTDMSEHRLALARELGADVTINIKEQDPVEVVMDMTGGWGVDCAIEAVGITPAVQQAHKLTRNGGDITWIGNSALMIEVNMQEVVTRELTVRGTYGFSDEFTKLPSTRWRPAGSTWSRSSSVSPPWKKAPPSSTLAKGDLDLAKVILEP